MKNTKKYLKNIIKEEIHKLLKEFHANTDLGNGQVGGRGDDVKPDVVESGDLAGSIWAQAIANAVQDLSGGEPSALLELKSQDTNMGEEGDVVVTLTFKAPEGSITPVKPRPSVGAEPPMEI